MNNKMIVEIDTVTITATVSSLAVILYCTSGILPLLKVFILCIVILLLLYLLLKTDSAIPSDLLYHCLHPTKIIQNHPRQDEFSEHDDQITKKLRQLSTHYVQDFILSWYRTVTDDVTFVQDAFEVFEHICNHSRHKVSLINREKLLNAVLVVFTEHVVAYKNAKLKVDRKFSHRTEKDKEDDIAIAYVGETSDHPIMKRYPVSEMEYLRGIALLLLKEVLPANYIASDTPLYLVRELIMQNVLLSLVDMLCDPLFVMEFVTEILSDGTEERRHDDVAKTSATDVCDITSSDLNAEASNPAPHPSVVTTEDSTSALPSGGASDREHVQCNSDTAETPHCNGSIQPGPSAEQLLPVASSAVSSDSQVNREDVPLPFLSTELHFAPEWNPGYTEQLPHILASSDKRQKLFHRIRIVEVIIMREAYDASKKYALYKITYNTKEERTRVSEAEGEAPDCARKVEIVNKRHQVQRRFREFLALQERLAQNMMAKSLLSNIRGPSRMFPVPFGNMDNGYIEQRKKFLQAYLREISSIPYISRTKELREFLAFESDPRIAYVIKPEPIPRFDKLFKSAFQDLFGSTSMKFTTLSSQDYSMVQDENDESSPKISSSQSLPSMEIENVGAVAKLKYKVFGSVKHTENDRHLITSTTRQYADFPPQQEVFKSCWKASQNVDPLNKSDCGQMVDGELPMRGYGDGCDFIGDNKNKAPDEPFSLSAELIVKLVCHNWNLTGGHTCVSSLALKRYIQSYLDAKVEELTSDESWNRYLTLLIESLWPEGEWRNNDGVKRVWLTCSDEKKFQIITDLEQCLKRALPRGLGLLVGEDAFLKGISQLVSSLQDKRLNRRLFYGLLDQLLKEIFGQISLDELRSDVTLNFISGLPS